MPYGQTSELPYIVSKLMIAKAAIHYTKTDDLPNSTDLPLTAAVIQHSVL